MSRELAHLINAWPHAIHQGVSAPMRGPPRRRTYRRLGGQSRHAGDTLVEDNRLPRTERPVRRQDVLRARLSAWGPAGRTLRAREGVERLPGELLVALEEPGRALDEAGVGAAVEASR